MDALLHLVIFLPLAGALLVWLAPSRPGTSRALAALVSGRVLLFLLLGILVLYFGAGIGTFDMIALSGLNYALPFQVAAFLLLAVAFAVKIPIFPFHTWLPDAHVEAPTAISVLLAGVLLKMGGYGILRVNFSILPAASYEFAFWLLGVIGVVNIVYRALCPMPQAHYKKLMAYAPV